MQLVKDRIYKRLGFTLVPISTFGSHTMVSYGQLEHLMDKLIAGKPLDSVVEPNSYKRKLNSLNIRQGKDDTPGSY